MTLVNTAGVDMAPDAARQLARRVISDEELTPRTVDAVLELASFASKMRECERIYDAPYSEISHPVQDALVLRRLQQMVNTVLLNPLWRERLNASGITAAPATFEEWQDVPLSDKDVQRDMFMDSRPGMVVPAAPAAGSLWRSFTRSASCATRTRSRAASWAPISSASTCGAATPSG
jgi:phenylacetate-CoA ligase